MRPSSYVRFSYSVILISLLAACDQNGGVMPINGQSLLSGFEGPHIPTMQDNQLEAAKTAEKNENFAQASQIYQQILERDPETTDVVQLLADSLRRNGEYDKAISVYEGLLAKNPSNLAAKEGKALTLLAKGDFETPTVLFEEVLKTDPKRWKSLNGMGILFVTRGLYPDSIKYFEEAIKQNPDNISVMNNLGLSQALNKKYEQAIDILSKALARSNANSLARKRIDLNLALVYASAGKLDEARKIAEIYLSNPELNNNLGLYAHLAKNDGLAKSYLNMALTESKTYYGKAWDNLEALNASSQDNNKDTGKIAVDNQEKPMPEKSVEEKPGNKPDTEKPAKSKKSKVSDRKQPTNITITREPDAIKSEVKSLGTIIAHELKKDDKAQPATGTSKNSGNTDSPLIIMPNEIVPEEITQGEKRITVDNVIDDMVKTSATKTTKPASPKPVAGSPAKYPGTVKMPNSKIGDTATETVPQEDTEGK